MPYLAFNLNDGNEFVFDLLEDRLSIGREARNDIVIDNTFISGFHAEFVRGPDGGYEVVDLKSSNGTFVNGKRVMRAKVKGGDKIGFGQLEARFRDRAPKGSAPAEASKPALAGKAEPSRADGRRGDTESVPVQGPLTITPASHGPTPETSKVELTKPPLARPEASKGLPPPPAPTSVLPPKPAVATPAPVVDEAARTEAKALKEEIEKLKREREAATASMADQKARHDKEMAATVAKLQSLKTETESLARSKGEMETARADVTAAKRELSVLQGTI